MGSGSTVKNKVGCKGNGFTCFTKQKCYHVLSIHYVAIVLLCSFFIGRSKYFTILTLPSMLTLFTTLTLFTIVVYIFFTLITTEHILRYKYQILTLKACNLQTQYCHRLFTWHSASLWLSLTKCYFTYLKSIIFLVHKHYLLRMTLTTCQTLHKITVILLTIRYKSYLTTCQTLHKITVILLTIRYKSYLHESLAPGDNIMTVAWLWLQFSKATCTYAHVFYYFL